VAQNRDFFRGISLDNVSAVAEVFFKLEFRSFSATLEKTMTDEERAEKEKKATEKKEASMAKKKRDDEAAVESMKILGLDESVDILNKKKKTKSSSGSSSACSSSSSSSSSDSNKMDIDDEDEDDDPASGLPALPRLDKKDMMINMLLNHIRYLEDIMKESNIKHAPAPDIHPVEQ